MCSGLRGAAKYGLSVVCEADEIYLVVGFLPRANLMFEQYIANAKCSSDIEHRASNNSYIIDKGAIGRIEIGDAQLVPRQFD